MVEKKVVVTSGKRKTAIARAIIKPGKGIYRFNKMLVSAIPNPWVRLYLLEPLILLGEDRAKKVNIHVFARGGGFMAQAEAARLAVARGLVKFFEDKTLEKEFLEYDKHMLIADVRRTEPQKPYRSAARRHRQTSKR